MWRVGVGGEFEQEKRGEERRGELAMKVTTFSRHTASF